MIFSALSRLECNCAGAAMLYLGHKMVGDTAVLALASYLGPCLPLFSIVQTLPNFP